MGFPGGIGLSAGAHTPEVPFPWDLLEFLWAEQSPPRGPEEKAEIEFAFKLSKKT